MGIENLEREDAALVYRFLRDAGPATVVDIAEACFPLTFGRDDPLYERLIKKSVTRAFHSIDYMRASGKVQIRCVAIHVPGELSVFALVV